MNNIGHYKKAKKLMKKNNITSKDRITNSEIIIFLANTWNENQKRKTGRL